MDYIKFSVIIPMYNADSTIINTVESVLHQTRFDLIEDIIIVNDGSIDRSLEKIEKFISDNKLSKIKIINQKNSGVSAARNKGISEARAEWIALLDSDDEWLPNKIEIQAEIIYQNSKIDFLGNSHDGMQLKILNRKIEKLYKASVKDLCIKQFPATSTIVFKKEIFDAIGGYDESMKYGEDANFCLKVANKFNYYYSPENVLDFGHGKPEFGFSGLSANLQGMYDGHVKNLKELDSKKMIGKYFYLVMRIFFLAKYIRRIIIVKFRGIK